MSKNPFLNESRLRQKAAKRSKPMLHPTVYNPQLPFSSPIPDDQRSIGSTNTYQTHNPFLSPDPSRTPSVAEESDSTCGQDAFHLERYSQSVRNERRHRKTGDNMDIPGSRDDSPSSRLRPGLNIITDFSRPDGRSMTDGMVVEQVQASRPKLGHRSVTSVVSQKVEHGFQASETSPPPPPPQPSGFINLNDLAKLRQQGKERGRNGKEGEAPAPSDSGTHETKLSLWRKVKNTEEHSDSGIDMQPRRQHMNRSPMPEMNPKNPYLQAPDKGISPADRSIVIGISVPKDEADAHQPRPGDSALTLQTPGTPTIVVTPATGIAPWAVTARSGREEPSRRPISSVYSQMTTKDRFYFADEDAPPVPDLRNKDGFILDQGYQQSQPHAADQHDSRRESMQSFETIFDDEAEPAPLKRPRSASGESQKQILPWSGESARPKSKGWWNIMLSPMLSRAGTQKTKNSPENAGVPAAPPFKNQSAEDTLIHESTVDIKISPETPRRLGLGAYQADSWPTWTEWEVARGKAEKSSDNKSESPLERKVLGHKAQESAISVPVMMASTPGGEGLAAEYFYACAVDERGGELYFACENHSCAERLPILGFVSMAREFDTSVDEKRCDQHLRSGSDSTIIEDDPTPLFSPNIRLANKAPILRANVLESKVPSTSADKEISESPIEPEEELPPPKKTPGPPAYSPARPLPTRFPNLASVIPPRQEQPLASPGPISPEMQRAMAPQGAVPMSTVHVHQAPAPVPVFFTANTSYPDLPARTNTVPVSFADISGSDEVREKGEVRRQRLEKEDAVARKAGGLWRGRGCFPKNGCFGREGAAGRTKRRWYIGIGGLLLAIIITCIGLATQLTRKGDHTPIQSQWLNLTGFPPMPTGISTIAQPDPTTEDTSCVQPSTLWSCAVPKEDQASIAPNNPDQPNFRFEIRFRNGTVPANETVPLTPPLAKRSRIFSPKKLLSRQNDPFTNALFTPTPAPPSINEQIFLGNTTDNITFPFDGEKTPFFITFISTTPVLPAAFNDTTTASSIERRQTTNSSSSILGAIPAPDIAPDGTAAAANLLPNDPLPFSQPIRLYNRGSSLEHYGFYTYFDRAIFLRSDQPLNSSTAFDDVASIPDDQNGGSTKDEASVRCTWSQTRFLVKIWTSPDFGAKLLGNPDTSADGIAKNSATDFASPGSFPYPVSISLDRHGGSLDKKGVYCYGVDAQQRMINDEKAFVNEVRGFGGVSVNPAPPLVTIQGQSNGFDPNAGGIDGGTGGCRCEWRNFVGLLS